MSASEDFADVVEHLTDLDDEVESSIVVFYQPDPQDEIIYRRVRRGVMEARLRTTLNVDFGTMLRNQLAGEAWAKLWSWQRARGFPTDSDAR